MPTKHTQAVIRKRAALARRIRRVARQMAALGTHMNYYYGFSEIGQHGLEMMGAANIAKAWAKAIVAGNKKTLTAES